MGDATFRYFAALWGSLHVNPRTRSDVLYEAYGHLEERTRELAHEGVSAEAAEHQALADFGDPREIAQAYYSVHATTRGRDTLFAVLPHIGIAAMFRFHLWVELFWVAVAVSIAVATATAAWRRGLPNWTAPWLGYALVLPAMTWVVAAVVVGYGAWAFISGGTPPLSLAMYIAVATWIPVATIIILTIARRTLSYDWLVISLASLPLPFLSAWLFMLHWQGGVLIPDRVRALEMDTVTALVFLALAGFTALFMRIGRRSWRLVLILALVPPLAAIATLKYHAAADLATVIGAIVLTAVLLVSPVLLDPVDRASLRLRRRDATS